jgi:hypothetical protein
VKNGGEKEKSNLRGWLLSVLHFYFSPFVFLILSFYYLYEKFIELFSEMEEGWLSGWHDYVHMISIYLPQWFGHFWFHYLISMLCMCIQWVHKFALMYMIFMNETREVIFASCRCLFNVWKPLKWRLVQPWRVYIVLSLRWTDMTIIIQTDFSALTNTISSTTSIDWSSAKTAYAWVFERSFVKRYRYRPKEGYEFSR